MTKKKNGTEVAGDQTPAPLAVTPASEFRRVREKGELITIPQTGRVIRIRPVKPIHVLKGGKVPDPLSNLVLHMLYGQMTSEEYDKFFTLVEQVDQALEMLESLRIVCTAALVEPRIVENPQGEDEIHIDDLEDKEQRFIFDLAFLEASDLARFRREQEKLMEDVAAIEDAELSAEPVGGG